jgi:hypothetical protein
VLCHDDVGYSHLTTQLGQDIVGDDKKLSFLRLNQGNNVVQQVLDEQWLFGVL